MIKKLNPFLVVLMLLVASFSTYSQNPESLIFRGERINLPENIRQLDWNSFPESSKLNDGFTGIIQFYNTPDQETQDAFKRNNFQLLEYIPHQAYFFYFPSNVPTNFLINHGVRSIVPVSDNVKLSIKLKAGDFEWWAKDGENVLIMMKLYDAVNFEYSLSQLYNYPVRILKDYPEAKVVELSVPEHTIATLAAQPYIQFIDLVLPPAVPEDLNGRSIHRASNLDSQTTAGRNYTGAGVGVLVRDDGYVGPHIDFQGRLTNMTGVRNQSHGDGVAGIMAGAGNIMPRNRGMAAGANIYVVNYTGNFLDYATNSVIDNGNVQITNSSYGQGCNEGYTYITNEVDRQMNANSSLLHVFSAGNSNGQSCGYGAGGQWGNITGGHKQGKNVITTANVFANGNIVSSSSRGPAEDGRIKPDIAAHGQNQVSTDEHNTYQSFGGTSAAAPGIAGVSAQLYEAYSNLNNGDHPPAALIKAALLNTANDAGNVGPDFKYGWGIVNGLQAAKLIEDGRYLLDSISQGQTQTHTITIPAGVTQVRFMLYWSDKEATAGAKPALVNDLDLTVTDPANTTLLPWVLDTTPNPVNLDTPATNGIDRLNNMEQVLINNPAAGSYTVNINGFNIPFGPQEYFLVYEVIEENLNITYPIGGESMTLGQQYYIHWDATNVTDDFELYFSEDNGTTWDFIDTVPSTERLYLWRAPSIYNGQNLIKIVSGTYESISPEPFSIGRYPLIINVSSVCPDTLTLTWSQVANADAYDVYLLGEKYMEVVGTTSNLTIDIPITDPNATFWYSVSAKNTVNGWVSERARAKEYSDGIVNCSVVGIEDNLFESEVKIYPNPAQDEITILYGDLFNGNATISIFNNLGQMLKQHHSSNMNSETLNISELAQGIYFIKISSGKAEVTKKLIVK